MSDRDMTQRAFTTILAHLVAAGRAPHYTELADTLDVDLDTARSAACLFHLICAFR